MSEEGSRRIHLEHITPVLVWITLGLMLISLLVMARRSWEAPGHAYEPTWFSCSTRPVGP